MRTKVKAIIAIGGVLLVITAISLVIVVRGPLYGKATNDNWVPDMIGEWATERAAIYTFEDVTDPTCTPVYIEGVSYPEGVIHITEQTGRVFAGKWEGGHKVTGVILPDRTVSMQEFEPSELRFFITGRLTKSGDALQISGYSHMFDDFGISPDSDKMMASTYGRLVKVN
jgi:hypothetical protein